MTDVKDLNTLFYIVAGEPTYRTAYPFGAGAPVNVYVPNRPTEPEKEYEPHAQKVGLSIFSEMKFKTSRELCARRSYGFFTRLCIQADTVKSNTANPIARLIQNFDFGTFSPLTQC